MSSRNRLRDADLRNRRFLTEIRDAIGATDDVYDFDDLPDEVRRELLLGATDVQIVLPDDGGNYRARLLPAGFASYQVAAAKAALTDGATGASCDAVPAGDATETLGYQLLFAWGLVEMHAEAPVATFEQLLTDARALRAEYGDEHGYFYLQLERTADGTVSAAAGSFTHDDLATDGV